MKHLILLLMICISLISCEKANENSPLLEVNFDEHILNDYFVTAIAFDKQGNTWIGTFKQGVIKYNSKETIVYNSTNSLIPDKAVINDIAVDSKNNVWIAGEGLIKFDGDKFTCFNSANTPIPEDNIGSIAIDSKDNVWFTSCRFKQGGIVKYDGTTWNVFTPDNSDLPVSLTRSIVIDKEDNVWLTLNEIVNESYLVKISDKEWQTFTHSNLGFKPFYLGNAQINSQGKICVGVDYSLSSAKVNNGTKVFLFDETSTIELQHKDISNVRFITVDNKDNIWCGTDNGYAVYNGETWIVDNTSFKEQGVFVIKQSPDNSIWIGTGKGVYISKVIKEY